MMRVADYVMKTLADRGVRDIFLLTGGGAMFLNEAIRKEKRLNYICNHHEQACAMAAEAYARVSGRIGVINVTTGPGGINALNGVFGAWTDSIPMLIISGQVKRETCLTSYKELAKLRQLGDQEADIVTIAKSITKYAVTVKEPQEIRYHLEKALHEAENGRPGPCWLDIPVDVQSTMIDEKNLKPFTPTDEKSSRAEIKKICREILIKLQKADRPVILAGSGVHVAKAEKGFANVINKLKIPVATAWTAIDLMDTNNPLYCGRPGFVGDRAGNFTVQNSDLLIIIGSRLPIRQVSYNAKSFARDAFKVQIDVDPIEFKKPFIKIDLPVLTDALIFLEEFNNVLKNYKQETKHKNWLKWCKERVTKYPVWDYSKDRKTGLIDPYEFYYKLSEITPKNTVIACANAAASVIPFQTSIIKKGQRIFTNAGAASMGYELPAAIGAHVAFPDKNTFCFAGDGSIQLNIQELQTIVHNQMPIKIFVLNNGGYLSIRATQNNFFEGKLIGESNKSGVSFPDIIKLSKAYGIKTFKIKKHSEIKNIIQQVIDFAGPVVCEVIVDPKKQIEPKLASRRLPNGQMQSPPLEDMFPFLDRNEFQSNLLISEFKND